jgi:hypothetical protein
MIRLLPRGRRQSIAKRGFDAFYYKGAQTRYSPTARARPLLISMGARLGLGAIFQAGHRGLHNSIPAPDWPIGTAVLGRRIGWLS